MRPLKLALTNWMPFIEEELDLSNVKVAALTGENGAGKSAILDAITWALWGKARGDSDEDRIRAGAQQCGVALTFGVNGCHFRVIRTKKRGKGKASGQSTLTLDDDRDLTGATIKETQTAIIDLIKMDYDTFCNSVYLRQGHSDEFTVADPADRKRVLINILSLDQYDALEVKAKDVLKGIENSILVESTRSDQVLAEAAKLGEYALLSQNAGARLDPITLAIITHESTVANLEAQAAQLAPKREELARLRHEGEKLGENLMAAQRKRDRHGLYAGMLEQTVTQKAAILKGYEDLQQAEAQRQELSGQARVLADVNEKSAKSRGVILQAEAQLKSEVAKAEAQIKGLSSALPEQCPTCGQMLNPEKQAEIAGRLGKAMGFRDAIREQLEAKSYAMAEQKELAQLETYTATLKEGLVEWDKVQTAVKRLEQFRGLLHGLQDAEANIEKEKGYLKEAEDLVRTYQESCDIADRRYENLTTALKADGDIDRRLQIAKADLGNAKSEMAIAQKTMADLTAKVDFARKCADQAQEIEGKLKELKQRADIFKFLAGAFNKGGIPSEIIKAAAPELESEANRFLGEMTEGRMSLALLTQRDNRSGTTTETLDIVISDELGMRPYELYSGGEAFRVNLALRLALSKMVARRAGAPMSCLILDEGLGCLDESGKDKVIETINTSAKHFDLTLVITHLEEIKDAFGTQIRVTKDGTGAKVAVLN